MSDPNHPETPETQETSEAPESTESFDQLLSEYEREHKRVSEDGARQIEGTVVAVTADAVLLDIGFKSEGTLPLTDLPNAKPGDKIIVSVKGRDADGYYLLSRTRIAVPKDWTALEKAFTEKATIVGTVTAVVKGGAERGRRGSRVHAGFAQRNARRRRVGKDGRTGNPLPHHQARRHRRRRGGRPSRVDRKKRNAPAKSVATPRSGKAT